MLTAKFSVVNLTVPGSNPVRAYICYHRLLAFFEVVSNFVITPAWSQTSRCHLTHTHTQHRTHHPPHHTNLPHLQPGPAPKALPAPAAAAEPEPCSPTPPLATSRGIGRFFAPTSLKGPAWANHLSSHPDKKWVACIVDGIRNGVRVGYNGPRNERLRCVNLPSARAYPKPIDIDLAEEAAMGRIAGPFDTPPIPNLICSPVGSVAKKNSEKRRRIHHLSWPRNGSSVNQFIEDQDCSYETFDDAISMVLTMGKGCYLSKVDIKAAFRCIPVHPDDWHLLGMLWHGKYWVDLRLPFGLKSSPALWERYATAMVWMAKNNCLIDWLIHYVDDFLLGGKVKDDCTRATLKFLKLLKELGVPVAPKKLEMPATFMKFLGIMIDTIALTASLDKERLQELVSLLNGFKSRSTCTAKELQSLIGKLMFASRVVRAGRVFTNRMLALRRAHPSSHGKDTIVLPPGFKKDVHWWLLFLPQWNGVSILGDLQWRTSHQLHLYTDASRWGFGAVFGSEWIYGPWLDSEYAAATRKSDVDVNHLEIRALAKAVCTWGHQWNGWKITFHCDNEAVVNVVQSGKYRADGFGDLLRSIYMIAALNQFDFRIVHIAGLANTSADYLSRNQVEAFKRCLPSAAPSPTIPLPLPTLKF